jgi:glutamine synthetase
VKAQMDIITELSNHINKAYELNNQMTNERAKANKLADAHEKALVYNKKVKGLFDEIRESCDEIERLVDDSDWVLPKYRELLSLS